MRNMIVVLPFVVSLCFPGVVWAHDKAFGVGIVSFLVLLSGVILAAPASATALKLLIFRIRGWDRDRLPVRTFLRVGGMELSLVVATMFLTVWLVVNDAPATLAAMLSDEWGVRYSHWRSVHDGGVEFYHWEALWCWVILLGFLSAAINVLVLRDPHLTLPEALGRVRERMLAALLGLLCPLTLALLMIVVFFPITLGYQSHESLTARETKHAGGEQLNRLLADAVRKGNARLTEALLKNGGDANRRTKSGRTLLMLAAWKGHPEVVKILHDHGADINAKTPNGMTALILAAGSGHLEVVEYLVKIGADINAVTVRGPWTALIAAAQWPTGRSEEEIMRRVEKRLQVLRFLMDRNADVNVGGGRLLRLLAAWPMGSSPKHPEIAEEYRHILERVTVKTNNVDAADDSGRTALRQAVNRGDEHAVRLLAANRADVNMPGKKGWTPLMEASRSGNSEMALLLLDLGADVNVESKTGETPISVAPSSGMRALLKGWTQ